VSWLILRSQEADNAETKMDLANRSFKDIGNAVKSGEALFRTSRCSLQDQASAYG